MLQENNEKIHFKIFPVSSHLHYLCKHYKTWSFQYNRDNACRWNVFSSSVTKRKCHKVVLEHSRLNQCLIQYQLHVHVTQILELRALRQVIYQVA